jgi:hypothetical protein
MHSFTWGDDMINRSASPGSQLKCKTAFLASLSAHSFLWSLTGVDAAAGQVGAGSGANNRQPTFRTRNQAVGTWANDAWEAGIWDAEYRGSTPVRHARKRVAV